MWRFLVISTYVSTNLAAKHADYYRCRCWPLFMHSVYRFCMEWLFISWNLCRAFFKVPRIGLIEVGRLGQHLDVSTKDPFHSPGGVGIRSPARNRTQAALVRDRRDSNRPPEHVKVHNTLIQNSAVRWFTCHSAKRQKRSVSLVLDIHHHFYFHILGTSRR